MTPGEFARSHRDEWAALEQLIAGLRQRGEPDAEQIAAAAGFPLAYRRLCQQLALARTRHYPPPLVERLNALALAGHEILYGPVALPYGELLRAFLLREFPALVRRHRAPLLWSLALTVLPALAMALAVALQPELVYSLLDPLEVRRYESMYRDAAAGAAAGSLPGRGSDADIEMFGYYIGHNISIGFRCFAGGLLLGSASVLALVFNGLMLGGLTVHLVQIGEARRFLSFVATQSAFELTAIVLCGQAGLLLAQALIAPGRQRRLDALQSSARDAVRIVYGAAGMLVLAAFLEAFWSSSQALPLPLKYSGAALLWSLVLVYFLRMGRDRAL